MSVPGYCANTSPVTSGYPCCNNLLVQVTPLKQTKLVFSLKTRRGLDPAGADRTTARRRWREPSLTLHRCKTCTTRSRITANTPRSLGRSSIRQMWQQPPREEAILKKVTKSSIKQTASQLPAPILPACGCTFFYFLHHQLIKGGCGH